MIVQPMIMTGGGPSNSTTLVYDIYETGTVNWEIGLCVGNGGNLCYIRYHYHAYTKCVDKRQGGKT